MRFVISLCLLLAWPSQALNWDDLNLQGQGTMRYLLWDLYHARLYTTKASSAPSPPLALQLHYLREIKAEHLLQATNEQWQAQQLQHPHQSQWLTQLAQLWPDVDLNDQLTLYVDNAGHSHFYLNQQLLGSISDTEFAPQFLAIWLSENSSEPQLRAQLLGVTP